MLSNIIFPIIEDVVSNVISNPMPSPSLSFWVDGDGTSIVDGDDTQIEG
jgi:hypothetical protein